MADTFIPAHVEPLRRKSRENGTAVTRVIVSSHDYEATGTVEELSELVARMQACGADVAKFACTAKDITDTAKVFHILSNAQVGRQQSRATRLPLQDCLQGVVVKQ